jgi:hypothetical protein
LPMNAQPAEAPLARASEEPGLILFSPFQGDAETFDFLVEGGEGNLEAFRGVGLAPIGAREHVEDNAALTRFHDFEERPAFDDLIGGDAVSEFVPRSDSFLSKIQNSRSPLD